ncbi:MULTISPECIES: hypothetical protein [Nostocales]|jgi:hypothetical protein|uniref:Uncharacterized protein n=1 Tax=Dolichospermum flos-aquae UHCC 0037 TaxID=2590026 RepID=A0ACC7SD38_DOLFA|nr:MULTISPECIES: hypothetical protein [Nostocales]MBO1067488.1 hypothetical protein [Anabaena sp. 54]MTJ45422.1 hypothetical protein [Dolichospermum flos-aquae UHCC 0037]
MNNFKILLSSDPNYEQVVAEIYYADKYVGLINQDDPQNLLFILPVDCESSVLAQEIPLNILLEAIKAAVERLGRR